MSRKSHDFSNWWYYHKWHVCIGAVLLFSIVDIGKSFFHIGETVPDYQIAYIGENSLPDDTVAQIENLFSSIGKDCNHDGKIVTVLHQYPTLTDNTSSDAVYYQKVSSVSLQADLADKDSFFFLLEDPASFEQDYDTLAYTNGSLPATTARDYENMAISWSDSTLLKDTDLGTYTTELLGETITGNSSELLAQLYLARRGFWSEDTCNNYEECEQLWNQILGISESEA